MNNYEKFAAFSYPATLPIRIWLYHPIWKKHGRALEDLILSHPNLFPDNSWRSTMEQPTSWRASQGIHTDHWGCTWHNMVEGHDSICVGHVLTNLEDVGRLPIPKEDVGLEHGLMFLRMTYLLGYEAAMIDFWEEKSEFYELLKKVLAYNMRQVHRILKKSDVTDRVVTMGDDFGMQDRIPIGAEKWRKILKPCFEQLCEPCNKDGKLVFLHSDGCIHEIIPDLHDCGVDIVNPQIGANGIDALKMVCRGTDRNRIAISLTLDAQIFPLATPTEIEDHIMSCVNELGLPEGGLALEAEIDESIPLENISAIFNALEKARIYF